MTALFCSAPRTTPITQMITQLGVFPEGVPIYESVTDDKRLFSTTGYKAEVPSAELEHSLALTLAILDSHTSVRRISVS